MFLPNVFLEYSLAISWNFDTCLLTGESRNALKGVSGRDGESLGVWEVIVTGEPPASSGPTSVDDAVSYDVTFIKYSLVNFEMDFEMDFEM